jgi:hypothetical protein
LTSLNCQSLRGQKSEVSKTKKKSKNNPITKAPFDSAPFEFPQGLLQGKNPSKINHGRIIHRPGAVVF